MTDWAAPPGPDREGSPASAHAAPTLPRPQTPQSPQTLKASGAQARVALSLVGPPSASRAADEAAADRPRRRWYDRIPVWRWLSVGVATIAGAVVSVRMVGTDLVAFLVVTTVFVLLPPACVVAVVTLLITAWRSTSWRRRAISAALALLPSLLLYKCATAYDQVMDLFFAGQR